MVVVARFETWWRQNHFALFVGLGLWTSKGRTKKKKRVSSFFLLFLSTFLLFAFSAHIPNSQEQHTTLILLPLYKDSNLDTNLHTNLDTNRQSNRQTTNQGTKKSHEQLAGNRLQEDRDPVDDKGPQRLHLNLIC